MFHRLSVVVPTCNRSELLRNALASIRAVEGPDLRIEIIVGDNGSCPLTPGVAAEFGARYVKVERTGASESRNAAMALATGDYIAFLDDDDVWLPEHVRPHLAAFARDESLDMVIGQVVSTDLNYRPIGEPWLAEPPAPGPDLLRRLLSGYFPQIGAIIVRRRVREEIGGFDPVLIGGEDLDWVLRIAERGRVGFVKVPCILFALRNIGSFDELQLRRVKFDRMVFNRYALRWWRLWRSPMEYCRAYSGTVMHYYKYFSEAALERAIHGKRWQAIKAVFQAVRIFPLRSVKHLVSDTPLRQAVFIALFSGPGAHRAPLPIWLAVLHM